MEEIRLGGNRVRIHPTVDVPRQMLSADERRDLDLAMLHVRRGIESYVKGYFARQSEKALSGTRPIEQRPIQGGTHVDNEPYLSTSQSHYGEAASHFDYAGFKFTELERVATTDGVAIEAKEAASRLSWISLRMAARIENQTDLQVSGSYL